MAHKFAETFKKDNLMPTVKSNTGIFTAAFMVYTLNFNGLNVNLEKKNNYPWLT